MKRLIFAATLTVLMVTSTGANAWWGPFGGWGPWNNGWDNGWGGDGWFDFNFSFSGSGRGWGRGWNYYDSYGGPYDYYSYGYYPYWSQPYWGNYPYVMPKVAPTAPATTNSK